MSGSADCILLLGDSFFFSLSSPLIRQSPACDCGFGVLAQQWLKPAVISAVQHLFGTKSLDMCHDLQCKPL